jgi:hypothetical protein
MSPSHALGGVPAPPVTASTPGARPSLTRPRTSRLRYPQLQRCVCDRSNGPGPTAVAVACTTQARVGRRWRVFRCLGTTGSDRRAQVMSGFHALGLHVNFERALLRTSARHRSRYDCDSLVLRTRFLRSAVTTAQSFSTQQHLHCTHLTYLASAARPALSSPSSTTAGPQRPCCLYHEVAGPRTPTPLSSNGGPRRLQARVRRRCPYASSGVHAGLRSQTRQS